MAAPRTQLFLWAASSGGNGRSVRLIRTDMKNSGMPYPDVVITDICSRSWMGIEVIKRVNR